MRHFRCLALACAITLVASPAIAQTEAPRLLVIDTPPPAPPESPLDNFRLGMGFFHDPGTNALMGGQAAAFGFDLPVGHGLAFSLDTYNMYRDFGSVSYFMSINPVQFKYRLGLASPTPAFAPFATVGTGVSLMGLMGGDAGQGRLGIGLAGSGGVGTVINDFMTLELGLNGGRVASIGYYGWQLRLGTTFKSLGNLNWLASKPNAQLAQAVKRSLAGKVQEVDGTRLVLQLEASGPVRAGDQVLVYYQEEFTVKVARARLVSLQPGAAIAEVLVATEPVKPGYRVRAW